VSLPRNSSNGSAGSTLIVAPVCFATSLLSCEEKVLAVPAIENDHYGNRVVPVLDAERLRPAGLNFLPTPLAP